MWEGYSLPHKESISMECRKETDRQIFARCKMKLRI